MLGLRQSRVSFRDTAETLAAYAHLVQLVDGSVGHAFSLKPVLVGNDLKFFLRIDLKDGCNVSQMVGISSIKDLILGISSEPCYGIIKITQEMPSILDCFDQALDLIIHRRYGSHGCIVDIATHALVRNRKPFLHYHHSACDLFNLLQMVFDLQLIRLDLVEIGLSCLPVVAHSCPKPIVKVVLERIDPVGLILLECDSVRFNHLDQVIA